MNISIHLRYFASLREIMGAGEETLTMMDGSRVADIRALLQQRNNQLGTILERCVSAVNRRYVSPETVLHDGDELVFIPPMGGGGIHNEGGSNGATHSPDTRSA